MCEAGHFGGVPMVSRVRSMQPFDGMLRLSFGFSEVFNRKVVLVAAWKTELRWSSYGSNLVQRMNGSNVRAGRWMLGYGVVLVLCGLLGYFSNPAKAVTALISGGLFGAISAFLGWRLLRGAAWARGVALTTALLLLAVFAWRSWMSWSSVVSGMTDKLFAACLITFMALASAVTLFQLLRMGSRAGGDGPVSGS